MKQRIESLVHLKGQRHVRQHTMHQLIHAWHREDTLLRIEHCMQLAKASPAALREMHVCQGAKSRHWLRIDLRKAAGEA